MNYRILGPDEVIQAGDEWFDGTPVFTAIGSVVTKADINRFRRPIPAPDNLTRELAEALEGFLDEYPDQQVSAVQKSRSVLAKYKEQVKVYETVDGKAVKCA